LKKVPSLTSFLEGDVISSSERLKLFAMDQNSSPDAADEDLFCGN
jgi:hypothetical protein